MQIFEGESSKPRAIQCAYFNSDIFTEHNSSVPDITDFLLSTKITQHAQVKLRFLAAEKKS